MERSSASAPFGSWREAREPTNAALGGELEIEAHPGLSRPLHEQALRELVEELGAVGCFEIDPKSGSFYASAGLYRLLGVEQPTPLPWAAVRAFFAAEVQAALERGRECVLDRDEVFDRELELIHNDGRRSWTRLVLRRQGHGASLRLLGSLCDIDRRRSDEVALARLAASLGGTGTTRFYAGVARAMCEAFQTDAAFVFELRGASRNLALLAGVRDGHPVAPRAATRPSPVCQHVLHAERLLLVEGACLRFPDDTWTAGFEGWAGVTLRAGSGAPVGLVVVASRRPLEATELVVPMLEIVAGRVAAELERCRLEEQLREARVVTGRAHRLEALASCAGSIARDLGSHLGELFRHLDAATSGIPVAHPLQRDLAAIEKVVLAAEEQVGQLRTLSRPQTTLSSGLDLATTVRELEAELVALAVGFELELQLEPGGSPVQASQREIERLLVSLVVVARRESPMGGVLSIEVTEGWLDAAAAGELGGLPPGPWRGIVVAAQGGLGADNRAATAPEAPAGAWRELGIDTAREVAEGLGGHLAQSSRSGWDLVYSVYLPAAKDGGPGRRGITSMPDGLRDSSGRPDGTE